MKIFAIALCVSIHLQASLFDWFNPLSEKAKRAQTIMEGFDEVIEKALQDYQIPGVAVGVIVDGHIVYSKGFGYRDVEKKYPVTSNTLFAIGSCTKAFTSFAVATLINEGLLHWDDRIIDIAPDFRLHDPYATQNLTMRDLLTHRSGLPRHDFMWYNSKLSKEEIIRKLRYLEPSCNFRERYQYNNLMYLAAGYAIEQLTHKSWETLVQERILNPLDMKHTNFSVQEMQKSSDFAFPYIEKNGGLEKMNFRDISLIGPAGSMNSNLRDLSQWVQMQLNGGVHKNTLQINPSLLQEMHTPQVIVTGAPETKESLLYAYGMGWGIASYRGQYFLSHDGVSDGFTSTIGLIPAHKTGIIILSNRNLSAFPRILSVQIVDALLELPFIDWMKEGLEGIQKTQLGNGEDPLRKKETTPSHPLKDFTGSFEHPGYGTVNISLDKGKLYLYFNGILSELEHWHYDVFAIRKENQHTFFSREGSKITFRSDLNGDIHEVLIPFEPTVSDILFKRKKEETHSSAAYLQKFTGLYEIYGYTVEVAIRNHALCAIIPGQPLYELVPGAENEFTVKSMTGYNLRFVFSPNDRVEEVLFVQPYGAFSAKPKRLSH